MFQQARLTLTGWYVLIVIIISGTFSFMVYRMQMWELLRFEQAQRHMLERRMRLPLSFQVNEELINETQKRIITRLLAINGGVLLLAGFLSYWLSGKTLAPIQQMLSDQEQFVSDASHELKTPLTYLKTAMEVYLRNKKPTLSEAKLLLTDAVQEVNRLQKLSDSLLHLATTKNTRARLNTISLLQVVSEATKKLELEAAKKSITFQVQGVDVFVHGDKDELVQLLILILDNAVKYSKRNGLVDVTLGINKHMATISITDRGSGINKKDLPHLFNRFYRADQVRTSSHTGGFGLGLAIAKKIVTNYQGNITVTSIPTKKTTFTIRLPKASD